MAVAQHLRRVMMAGGDAPAISLADVSVSWKTIGATIDAVDALLAAKAVSRDALVGLLGRNRLGAVAAFVAVLGADRPLLLVNAVRPARLVAEEVAALNLACLIGEAGDLSPEVVEAARATGTLLLEVRVADGSVSFTERSPIGDGPFRSRHPGTLMEIQTSGTTGAPKRIPIAERTIEASLRDGVRTAKGAVEQGELTLKSSPSLMFTPLVHTSGTFNTLMALFEVRPVILFEKFDAAAYRDALVRYRPKFVPLPPTALKMMVDSDATREDFSSVMAVRAGTAPLSTDLQEQFEAKFGVPVLTTYGATEFMGAATSWTLDDYRQFGRTKRGSVGRCSKGVELRIVDPASGVERAAGEEGILEARIDRVDGGQAWIRTTDLARLDGDGFLYIIGRADDAIIRGGFKVMAGKVADVIRTFPGVFDAIVVGRADDRLGAVPVAVVEPGPAAVIAVAALRDHAKSLLTPYEVPARFHLVDKLPRTVSDKISRPDIREMLDNIEGVTRTD